MDELFNILTHLQNYHNTEKVFDPSDPVIESKYQRRDWTSSKFGHVHSNQELLRNMAQQRGIGVTLRSKVDADHTGDIVTRISRTGFFVYIISA